MTTGYRVTPSGHENHKQMQLWKDYTKSLLILYVPSNFNKWILIMKTLGKEFFHLQCLPYGLRCTPSHLVFDRDQEANWAGNQLNYENRR